MGKRCTNGRNEELVNYERYRRQDSGGKIKRGQKEED
jgi:hypothetical protein